MMMPVVVLGRLLKQRPIEPDRGSRLLILVEQGDGLRPQARAADLAQGVIQVEGVLGAWQGHAGIIRLHEGQAKVLAQMFHQKTRPVVPHHGPRGKLAQGDRAAHAVRDDVDHLGPIDARCLGKGEGISIANHGRGQGDLVAELDRLAASSSAQIVDRVREALEQGQNGGGIRLRGTHHERERAVDGTLLAARHRAVERMFVHDLRGIVDVAGKLGGAGGEVHEPGALPRGCDDAALVEVHLLDIGGVAQHGEDDVRLRGGLAGRGRPHGTPGDERVRLGLGAVVDRKAIAGIQKVARNGGAHDAGANEGNAVDGR